MIAEFLLKRDDNGAVFDNQEELDFFQRHFIDKQEELENKTGTNEKLKLLLFRWNNFFCNSS